MKKAQLPLIAELDLGDTEDFTAQPACKFIGTDNPRRLRAVQSLMIRPRKREEIDSIAGASNGPALISDLRDLGLGKHGLPCTMVPDHDRDGRAINRGVYHFSEAGRRAVNAWLGKRDAGANP